jgi:phenylalanyl-tRNA synthetase beta chain
MEFLSKNIHVEYPHKIFEVGDVVIVDETQESRTKTLKKVACAIADKKSSYEDISSVADAFLSYFGARHRYVKTSHKSFIPGRVAKVLACERAIGIIGEIHPYVLNNWGIEKPVSAFELDVGMLFDIKCALK